MPQNSPNSLFDTQDFHALTQSDPEFIANMRYFVESEVAQASSHIDSPTRAKISLAATLGAQSTSLFSALLDSMLIAESSQKDAQNTPHITPIETKEIIYQATHYIGLAKSLEFLKLCNVIFKAKGIKLPLESQGKITRQERQEKGLESQRAIFGEAIDKGNATVPKDVQHIRRFLSANCFGDYYTRGGLDLEMRELLTLVFLVSLGGADSQVKSHIQGNLNMGKTRAFLIETFSAILPFIGYPRTLNALSALDSLTLNKEAN
ncbi:4-carboxymuconolactone decarboxylase [Helicobacter fennelliae]|uniref:4-carboxymuconolactone decarboxylase n=1 Tax=Helicobacter fennelliae TaxID=215 RepID=A0A2X3AX33_9HELI|nr:carboxymuconolactone decarboxylase family protein [Helicobacter fennelliae]SQB97398.1 4-carboxymuconolactone decarboxylase [Helicobacter fennelliae]